MMRKQELVDCFESLSRGLSEDTKRAVLPTTGRGGTSIAKDYTQANALLAEYRKATGEKGELHITAINELWQPLSPAVRFRLQHYSPMLAELSSTLKDDAREALYTSPSVVFTEKINGIRMWFIYSCGKTYLFSRGYSESDCSLIDYWEKINQRVTGDNSTIALDCEVSLHPKANIYGELDALGLITTNPTEALTALLNLPVEHSKAIQRKFQESHGVPLIVFHLIAPLYFMKCDYTKLTLGEGMKVYQNAGSVAKKMGLNIKPVKRCLGSKEEKKVFLNTILETGGEGVVAHFAASPYISDGKRSKEGMVKIKRVAEAPNGMEDTLDGWIAGYKVSMYDNTPLITHFYINAYIQEEEKVYEHTIAAVPVSQEIGQKATLPDPTGLFPQEIIRPDNTLATVSLNPEFGKVCVEVSGQEINAMSLRLTYPKVVQYRMDKSRDECRYTREFLASQARK